MSLISLEDGCLMRIALALWCTNDIKVKTLKIRNTIKNKWQKMENMVRENASKLQLPASLKDKLLVLNEQVGLKIGSWIQTHQPVIGYQLNLPVSLQFTSLLTIDKMETAEALLKNETISAKKRFFLACIYCIEEAVRNLGDESCHHGGFCNCMKSFWNIYIGGSDATDIQELLEKAFQKSAYNGNAAATKYFYNKLTLQNNNIDLVTVASFVADDIIDLKIDDFTMENRTDVLWFLFSKLNEEQRVNFIEINGYAMLKSFLVWPKHRLFIKTAKEMLDYLCENDYCELFRDIVEGVSCKCTYLKELIEKFWQESPESHKKYIIGNGLGSIIMTLYRRKDKRNMQIILNDLSVLDKIICCDSLPNRKKKVLYEYIIQECVLSPEEKKLFKDNFGQYNLNKEKKKRKAID